MSHEPLSSNDPMMQPCRRGCGELVHLENDGFHVCREALTSNPLLARLRKRKQFLRPSLQALWYQTSNPDPDCKEAADEIERLTATLKNTCEVLDMKAEECDRLAQRLSEAEGLCDRLQVQHNKLVNAPLSMGADVSYGKRSASPTKDTSGMSRAADETKAEHVCGLQGFGRGIGSENDVCPACGKSMDDHIDQR